MSSVDLYHTINEESLEEPVDKSQRDKFRRGAVGNNKLQGFCRQLFKKHKYIMLFK